MLFKKTVTITFFLMIVMLNGFVHSRELPVDLSRESIMSAAKDSETFLAKQATETIPANFVRLLLMRLIYGFAASMGAEERLADVFNGAFVPPNADEGFDFGFGDDDDTFDLFGGDDS
ncbi:hypothetical protein ACFFRR_002082 [Megaselia abdita]